MNIPTLKMKPAKRRSHWKPTVSSNRVKVAVDLRGPIILTIKFVRDFRITSDHPKEPMKVYSNINPLTPMNDQDRISPRYINTILSRQVLYVSKRGL